MKNEEWISFECIEIIQPLGSFYVGCIDFKDLTKIAYSDMLRITRHERREFEEYIGIERPLSPKRVAQLQKYVNTIDATFPTSIIIHLKSDDVEYDEASKTMKIKNNRDVAKIIDGQHRIEGLKEFSGDVFKLNVTIFVDLELEDQGMVFSVINLEQTKVNKSIVYSLYEYASTRSPQKTCHNIAKLLNNREKSPFKDKIKILGRATGRAREALTQGTFVGGLLPLISREPMIDRDKLKRKVEIEGATGSEERKLVFRNMFLKERDAEIAKVLWNYFAAVENRWFNAWYKVIPGNILNRTTGFGALMKFFPLAYLHSGKPGDVVPAEAFRDIFRKVELKDADFNPEKYKPGGTGINALFEDFRSQTEIYED